MIRFLLTLLLVGCAGTDSSDDTATEAETWQMWHVQTALVERQTLVGYWLAPDDASVSWAQACVCPAQADYCDCDDVSTASRAYSTSPDYEGLVCIKIVGNPNTAGDDDLVRLDLGFWSVEEPVGGVGDEYYPADFF